jgi:5-methylcytosine-specific restriction endonuclease McrA
MLTLRLWQNSGESGERLSAGVWVFLLTVCPTQSFGRPRRLPGMLRRLSGQRRRLSATPRERNRAWRTANPARARGLVRSWKLAHPDEVRAAKRGRHIAKRAATIEILSKAQRGRCAICHCRLGDEVHIDHIMPKALGGSNRRSNLQLTCAPCNMAKGPRHPLDHARSLGLLL